MPLHKLSEDKMRKMFFFFLSDWVFVKGFMEEMPFQLGFEQWINTSILEYGYQGLKE